MFKLCPLQRRTLKRQGNKSLNGLNNSANAKCRKWLAGNFELLMKSKTYTVIK